MEERKQNTERLQKFHFKSVITVGSRIKRERFLVPNSSLRFVVRASRTEQRNKSVQLFILFFFQSTSMMVSTKPTKFNRRKYFLTIIVLFLSTIEFSVANKSCKSTVMKIVMKQCSDATLRTRRGPASETSTFEESAISWDYRRFPKTATLPVALGDYLGFELTETELNELLSEIYERLGRNPTPENEDDKNKTKQLFLEIAARCCQNEAECLKEKIIDCP